MLIHKYGADFANEAASNNLINPRVGAKYIYISRISPRYYFEVVPRIIKPITRRRTDPFLFIRHISHTRD